MPVFFNFLRCKAIVASQPLRFPRCYTRPCQHTSVQSPSVLSFVIVNSRSILRDTAAIGEVDEQAVRTVAIKIWTQVPSRAALPSMRTPRRQALRRLGTYDRV